MASSSRHPPLPTTLALSHVKTTSILLGIYSTFVMSDHRKRVCKLGLLILDLILGVGGMLTTMLRKHTQQYHYKSRFTRYLQYFR